MSKTTTYPQALGMRAPRCRCSGSLRNMRLAECVTGTGHRYRCRSCGREAWIEAGCDGFDTKGRAIQDMTAPMAEALLLIDQLIYEGAS